MLIAKILVCFAIHGCAWVYDDAYSVDRETVELRTIQMEAYWQNKDEVEWIEARGYEHVQEVKKNTKVAPPIDLSKPSQEH